MSKRAREDSNTDRPPKRPRPEHTSQSAPVDDIHFASQLAQLLTFRQDGIQQLSHGIRSFKAFLEAILYHRNEDDRARQLSILREYLDSQKPADVKDIERPFLGQLWQAWSFANQNNNDYLASSVGSIVALLLRTLSGLRDFRDHGLLLCRTVLQHQHLRLVKRGLDAPKHKEFVISPCLRLLTEVMSFDGGVLARDVYKRREQTFDIATLRRNLGLVKTDILEEEAKRKPSMRTLTVRYVLAHLKYQQEGAKIDILKSRPLCIALFQHLRDDPSELVDEILTTTEQSVLKDNELPRSAKATLLLQHNLERVTDVATRSSDEHPAAGRAFAWLKAVCTVSSHGILRASGYYPPGTTKHDPQRHMGDSAIDLGLDSLEWYDSTDRPDVRNTTLLAWIQTLRPHADLKERELAITCFESAPELVAAYFAEKTMQLEPKLSNTWIGYASFLFEVVQLGMPSHLGNVEDGSHATMPPQTNILLENLLPRPLSQKVLTRCLNQSSELITFFAVRLLVMAFQKLSQIQSEMRQAADASATHRTLWEEALDRLMSRFTERAPPMKDVIATFRKVPDDNEHALQREAITHLLRLYYPVTPMQALEEQFDVSSSLTALLAHSGPKNDERTGISELRALELQHLLTVAQHSTGMRWFSKQGSLQCSPVVTLLKLHMSDDKDRQTRSLLLHVLRELDLVKGETELDALIASLYGVEADEDEVWTFVDDCLARASRQPVKYVDQLEAALADYTQKPSGSLDLRTEALPGLLAAVVAEQVAFAAKKPLILGWIRRFLDILSNCLPAPSKAAFVLWSRMLAEQRPEKKGAYDAAGLLHMAQLRPPSAEGADANHDVDKAVPLLPFTFPPVESDNHPELLRWAQKDLELAFEDHDIDALMLCLCSGQSDIRRQAHAQLRLLGIKLRNSSVEDRDALYVVVGGLIETYEQQCVPSNNALPYLAGTFAARALHVLAEPTHFIYPKLNRFLMRGPEWRITRLPSYWLTNSVLTQPVEDDAFWKEVQWVLGWLVDGLRTQADLDILRRGGAFGKAMALYSSPGASVKLVKEKVIEMLFRATCVQGGSTTLVTRTGVRAWLDMVTKMEGDVAALMQARVLETCDHERFQKWSGLDVDEV